MEIIQIGLEGDKSVVEAQSVNEIDFRIHSDSESEDLLFSQFTNRIDSHPPSPPLLQDLTDQDKDEEGLRSVPIDIENDDEELTITRSIQFQTPGKAAKHTLSTSNRSRKKTGPKKQSCLDSFLKQT